VYLRVFLWIWEQAAIISLYSINWLVFITETQCVYCAVRTGYLYMCVFLLSIVLSFLSLFLIHSFMLCYVVMFMLLSFLPSPLRTVFPITPPTNQQTNFYGTYMYSVAAVLYVQSVLHVMLFPMLNMSCTFTSALPAVCSAQYGCFLQLLNFALSRYVAQVLSDWFWDGSSRHLLLLLLVVVVVVGL
jgi:hypothetical protein